MAENDKKFNSEEELTDSVEQNFDAQQVAEDINSGEKEAPDLNLDEDYARSKQYDHATGADSSKGNVQSGAKPKEGDPEAFRSAARDVNPQK